MISCAFLIAASSVSFIGWKLSNAWQLSSTCVSSFMPDNVQNTPGTLAAKRRAIVAYDWPSNASSRIARTACGGSAKRPPFTGSIAMMGRPRAFATSTQARSWNEGLSQSR